MRRSYNHLEKLQGQNGIIKGQEQLKEAARSHFKDLFSEEGEEDPSFAEDLLENIPSLVKGEDNKEMEKPFSETKVCNTIWGMDPDKAPGPDGFTAHFYKICWETIKKYLLRLLRNFHRKEKLGEE